MKTHDDIALPPAGTVAMVAALNWGMGHATRCVPLIRALQERGCRVILASDGAALDFWKRELPELECRTLPSWRIRYAPGPWLVPGLLAGLPRMLRAIRAERSHVRRLVEQEGIGWILSDNRYGVRDGRIPSILMTHQLRLSLPRPFGFLESLTEFIMARLARRFDEVWIPDFAKAPGLSGKLGHPSRPSLFPSLRWIGPVTRMEPFETTRILWETVSVLSGPEPARSQFEAILRKGLRSLPGKHLIVRGRPDLPPDHEVSGNIEAVPHLPARELAKEMSECRVVITRGGYSTLMDLTVLESRCLLVPTPGQTEQEYLGRVLSQSGHAHVVRQHALRLEEDVEKAAACCALRDFSPGARE